MTWLTEPFTYGVQQRALLEVVLSGALCGALGTYVILRRLGFMSDALSHAVLPGVVLAYLWSGVGAVLYGALAAGGLASVAVGAMTRNRRIREDTAIGIVLAGGFALGIVLISTLRTYAGTLEDFLFGNILLVSMPDVWLSLFLGALVVAVMIVFHRRFILRAFDPDMADAMGMRGFLLDLLLLLTLATTVVISLRTIGNVLVVALLITPAATARLLTDRVLPHMLLAAALGATTGVAGMILAYHLNVATGALIVCLSTAVFVVVILLEPRRGLLGWVRNRRRIPGLRMEAELASRSTEAD